MVVASYCETLKFLRNMNFNIPLYDTLPSMVLRKLLFNLGINTTLSRLRKKWDRLVSLNRLHQIERYVFLRILWYEKTRLIHVLCILC